MQSNLYYVIYDITENKQRTKLIHFLKSVGLTRIQKSVFCGEIKAQQKKELIEYLKNTHKRTDSIYLIQSCKNCFGKIKIFGKGFDKAYVTNTKSAEVI